MWLTLYLVLGSMKVDKSTGWKVEKHLLITGCHYFQVIFLKQECIPLFLFNMYYSFWIVKTQCITVKSLLFEINQSWTIGVWETFSQLWTGCEGLDLAIGKSPSALSQPSAFHNSSLSNISGQECSYTLEQTQIKAKRGFCLLETKGEAVYFRCGNYISPARQISLTDGVCAECAV